MDEIWISLNLAAKRYPGGICAMARRLGKREKTLLSKLDPADDVHQPTVGEFVAILSLLDEEGRSEVLDRLAAIFGYQLATRPVGGAGSVTQAVLHSVTEHADIVREVEAAIEDGAISDQERDRILRECAEARRAITVLENTLRAGAAGAKVR